MPRKSSVSLAGVASMLSSGAAYPAEESRQAIFACENDMSAY